MVTNILNDSLIKNTFKMNNEYFKYLKKLSSQKKNDEKHVYC